MVRFWILFFTQPSPWCMYCRIRLKYINRYYYVRPSVYKFYNLLSSNVKKYLYNIACYAKEAQTLRNNSDFITFHWDLIVFSMYIYIYIIFFNARVSLNYYFDSPNWLITTFLFSFFFSAFITCVICCICQCWKLCAMYTFEINLVLFCSATNCTFGANLTHHKHCPW